MRQCWKNQRFAWLSHKEEGSLGSTEICLPSECRPVLGALYVLILYRESGSDSMILKIAWIIGPIMLVWPAYEHPCLYQQQSSPLPAQYPIIVFPQLFYRWKVSNLINLIDPFVADHQFFCGIICQKTTSIIEEERVKTKITAIKWIKNRFVADVDHKKSQSMWILPEVIKNWVIKIKYSKNIWLFIVQAPEGVISEKLQGLLTINSPSVHIFYMK